MTASVSMLSLIVAQRLTMTRRLNLTPDGSTTHYTKTSSESHLGIQRSLVTGRSVSDTAKSVEPTILEACCRFSTGEVPGADSDAAQRAAATAAGIGRTRGATERGGRAARPRKITRRAGLQFAGHQCRAGARYREVTARRTRHGHSCRWRERSRGSRQARWSRSCPAAFDRSR